MKMVRRGQSFWFNHVTDKKGTKVVIQQIK